MRWKELSWTFALSGKTGKCGIFLSILITAPSCLVPLWPPSGESTDSRYGPPTLVSPPGATGIVPPGACTSCTKTPASFRHDTCTEILTCLSRMTFAIGLTRGEKPFLTSLRSTDLKTARSPFNPATHSNAHKYFSLCNKKPGVVYQAAEHRSSYEEMFAPSARCQDGRCRLFQPPLPPPPGNKLFGRRIDSGMSVCSVFSRLLREKRGALVVH